MEECLFHRQIYKLYMDKVIFCPILLKKIHKFFEESGSRVF